MFYSTPTPADYVEPPVSFWERTCGNIPSFGRADDTVLRIVGSPGVSFVNPFVSVLLLLLDVESGVGCRRGYRYERHRGVTVLVYCRREKEIKRLRPFDTVGVKVRGYGLELPQVSD